MAQFERLEELTVGLYDVGALKFSDFEFTVKPRKWETEPRPSPIYYNQRPLVSIDPLLEVNGEIVPVELQLSARTLAVEATSHAIDQFERPYDHLFAIPQSETCIGGMVAFLRGESILWGRVGAKDYGAHSKIEGNFHEGQNTCDLDDVLTSFGSKQESAESKEVTGLKTQGFVVTLDREEGGAEAARKGNFELRSALGLTLAMAILHENGRIGQKEFDWVAQYHEGLRADGLL